MTSQLSNIQLDLEELLLQATSKDNDPNTNSFIYSNFENDLTGCPLTQNQLIYSMIQKLNNVKMNFKIDNNLHVQIQVIFKTYICKKMQKRIKYNLDLPNECITLKPLFLLEEKIELDEFKEQSTKDILQNIELDLDLEFYVIEKKDFIISKNQVHNKRKNQQKTKGQQLESVKLDEPYSSQQQSVTVDEPKIQKVSTRGGKRVKNSNKENIEQNKSEKINNGIIMISSKESSSSQTSFSEGIYYIFIEDESSQSSYSDTDSKFSFKEKQVHKVKQRKLPPKQQQIAQPKILTNAQKKKNKIRDIENQDKFMNYLNDVFNF